jgi:hypothetical protein
MIASISEIIHAMDSDNPVRQRLFLTNANNQLHLLQYEVHNTNAAAALIARPEPD